jgi:hypothetical protein
MNQAYTILVNSDGTLNAKQIMLMAHRRTKALMLTSVNSYASNLSDELKYAWVWAKSMQEYISRGKAA